MADQFDDLRDDGVSEGSKAVHPIGNPISHSTHVGFSPPRFPELTPSTIPTVRGSEDCCLPGAFDMPAFQSPAFGVGQIGLRKFLGERPADRSAIAFVLLASGVGNNPDAISSVRGTNGTRRNAMPFRVIPDLGQVPEYRSQPSTKQRCHVLQHCAPRSYHANGSNDFPVESRTGSGQSGTVSGKTEVLAWKPCRDDIGFALLKFVCRHVVGDRYARKILGKDALAIRITLYEPDRLKASRLLEADAESCNASEHFEYAPLAHGSTHSSEPMKPSATAAAARERTMNRRVSRLDRSPSNSEGSITASPVYSESILEMVESRLLMRNSCVDLSLTIGRDD